MSNVCQFESNCSFSTAALNGLCMFPVPDTTRTISRQIIPAYTPATWVLTPSVLGNCSDMFVYVDTAVTCFQPTISGLCEASISLSALPTEIFISTLAHTLAPKVISKKINSVYYYNVIYSSLLDHTVTVQLSPNDPCLKLPSSFTTSDGIAFIQTVNNRYVGTIPSTLDLDFSASSCGTVIKCIEPFSVVKGADQTLNALLFVLIPFVFFFGLQWALNIWMPQNPSGSKKE